MPNPLEIKIDDDDVRRFYARLPDKLEDAQRAGLEDGSALALRELSTYPPQRTGSRYVRTMTLSRSWSRTAVFKSGYEMRVQIGSSSAMAPYNRAVQDADVQAPVHVDVWRDKTVQAVARDKAQDFVDLFEARIQAALKP